MFTSQRTVKSSSRAAISARMLASLPATELSSDLASLFCFLELLLRCLAVSIASSFFRADSNFRLTFCRSKNFTLWYRWALPDAE